MFVDMKKLIFILVTLVTFSSCSKDEIDKFLAGNGLTNEEIIEGLKSALTVGTDTSVTVLNKLDGYYRDDLVKILLPEDAKAIYDNINKVPGGSLLLEETIKSLNRAAEDAAIEAKPIFIDAITSITINDGLSILNGADTAATFYLKDKTFSPLYNAFQPKIDASLNKELVGGVSANSAYNNLVSAYNTASLNGILFPKITTNSLSTHVTNKALMGLFIKVADEEKAIRTDPIARVNDILKKVFSK
jgi:hypothetical protein